MHKTEITKIRYNGKLAYRMTDGNTEAVIVPGIGRVMRYGKVGGENFLLDAPPKTYAKGEWKNWGGDKVWYAPQSQWTITSSLHKPFPPEPAWDSSPYKAELLPGPKLRITSRSAPLIHTSVTREFSFEANGDFVLTQTFEKTKGAPVSLALWTITQIPPPDAIFLPLNKDSAFKNNFFWFTAPDPKAQVTPLSPTLLQVKPTKTIFYKLGVDSPVTSLAAVINGIAFVQRGDTPNQEMGYAEGVEGHGFPVELYNAGGPDLPYNELELLSPLYVFHAGTRQSFTVRWSLHKLPDTDVDSPDLQAEVERLLKR